MSCLPSSELAHQQLLSALTTLQDARDAEIEGGMQRPLPFPMLFDPPH